MVSHGTCHKLKYSYTKFSLIRLFFYRQILKQCLQKVFKLVDWSFAIVLSSIFFFFIFDPYKVKDGPPLFAIALVL